MNIQSKPSSQVRARSPDKNNKNQPPFKRRRHRRWCDVVENYALANGIEEDARRVAQRQKQIDYGKNIIAYDTFNAVCPREERKRGEPMTPLARQKCSKRSFAGQITSWRKQVYAYVAQMDQQKKTTQVQQKSGTVELENNGPSAESSHPVDVNSSRDNEGSNAEQVHPTENVHPVHPASEPDTEQLDEDISDLEDITLDDFGNVVNNTPPQQPKDGQDTHVGDTDVSPASIFAAF